MEIIVDLAEDLCISEETYQGAIALGIADLLDLILGDTTLILLAVEFAVSTYVYPCPGGEGVYYRGTDAVQAAGNPVAVAAEFPTGVQGGHHCLQG